MITVLDYDAGNIKSVENALNFLGEEVKITRDREEILSSDGVILPGVGAFGDAMEKLHQYGLVDVIHEVVDRQIPFLGICLGLQLMFESSEETPGMTLLFPMKEDFSGAWKSIPMYILYIPIIWRQQILPLLLPPQNMEL